MPVDTGADSSLVPCRAFIRETAAPLKHLGSVSFFVRFVSEKAGVLGVHYIVVMDFSRYHSCFTDLMQ